MAGKYKSAALTTLRCAGFSITSSTRWDRAMTEAEALARLTAAGASGVMAVTAVPDLTADAEFARSLLGLAAVAAMDQDYPLADYLSEAARWHAEEDQ